MQKEYFSDEIGIKTNFENDCYSNAISDEGEDDCYCNSFEKCYFENYEEESDGESSPGFYLKDFCKCFRERIYQTTKCYIKTSDNEEYKLLNSSNCCKTRVESRNLLDVDEDFTTNYDKFSFMIKFKFNYEVKQRIITNPYENYLDNKFFNDITIVCSDGITLHANRMILALSSPVFKTMFETNMIECETKKIILDDIDSKTMQEFKRFVYSSKVENLKELAVPLLYASDKYEVSDLKAICIAHLSKNVKEDNVFETLKTAILFNLKILIHQCIGFIAFSYERFENTTEIKNLSEELQNKIIKMKKEIEN
ncbi:hypothetical protein PVAND_001396 [Polypedilum vanderplanki]|uniref:BTB domain-containing protein n=1 Tax=Polypedilum vanderplanki TaxID=319348 RepID=A0A9J6BMU4_POLVA|nr:hypothetical protein PVAND_001396 [Polypedilum vanderplanki]